MTATASIVQFPHPGPEHVPLDDWMEWNTTPNHKRKFMAYPGAIFDERGVALGRKTLLAFWGEWEAPSRVVRRWEREGNKPTVLHEPCWEHPDFPGFRQNTDPWVFGDSFLYSNCKQSSQARLRQLSVGSMILFGSTKGEHFVVDTVFVVGDVIGRYTAREADLPLPEAFRVCTIESLATDVKATQESFTLYRGATPADGLGMFSFVPARPVASDDPRFARPPIQLPGVINPRSKRSPSGARVDRPLDEVRDAWLAVVGQVQAADLALGCAFDLPSLCPAWSHALGA